MKTPWIPRAMRVAPRLDPAIRPGRPRPRSALLINPFYPKDPHASFGKHVLTPSLALTSIAGNTPADWTVRYWDENLLHGPPPRDPVPQGVGPTDWPGGIGTWDRRLSSAACTYSPARKKLHRTRTPSWWARGSRPGRRS